MSKKAKEEKQENIESLTEETTNVNEEQDDNTKDVDINKVMEDLNNQ